MLTTIGPINWEIFVDNDHPAKKASRWCFRATPRRGEAGESPAKSAI